MKLWHRMFGRRAITTSGEPHAFIFYGPGSQWIEHRLGVFRSYERLDRWQSWFCRWIGCRWAVEHKHYAPEAVAAAERTPVAVFMPPVLLRCRLCGVKAIPWQLWEESR